MTERSEHGSEVTSTMGLSCSKVWGVDWFCLTEDMASGFSERGN
jgi:hypothetical protein